MKYRSLFLAMTLTLLLSGAGSIELSAQSTNERVRTELTAEELSEANLRAFERRAVQKLRDLAARIRILSDPERDEALRERAREQVLKLFVRADVPISGFPSRNASADSNTAEGLLSALKKDPEGPVRLRIEGADCAPFQRTEEGIYRSRVSFRMVRTFPDQKQNRREAELEAELLLKKVEKRFGTESQQVWECLLGRVGERRR